jgi:predicted transcriptional regulator
MPRHTSTTLTEAELRVMEVLWDRGASTVAEVVQCLAPEVSLAYTTVLTTLRILEEKGHIAHTKKGRAHVYHPLVNRGEARRSVLRYMMDRFFDSSPQLLMVKLMEEGDLDLEEIRRLKESLAKTGEGEEVEP